MTETQANEGIQIEQKDNKVNIILDMSMFDLFELCKARYNYRHNLLKAPPMNQKARALDLGSLVHEGLDVYFNLLKQGVHYNDRMQAAIAKIQMAGADPDVSNSEPEDVNLVISAVEQSCDYWRFEDEQMEILEVEQAFAYILYEDEFVRIIVTGKIDLLVNIPGLGRNTGYKNLPVDHKSFQREFEVPRLSNQFLNYCNAVASNYLLVNRVGLYADSTKKKPEDKFKRVPLSYDHLMMEEWKTDIIHGILHEYLNCIATGYWKRNFTSCFKFNRRCEFYEICESSGAEAKMYKLERDYASISPWDVTAKLNQKEED